MSLTDDPNHPGLKRGPADEAPVPQNDAYLVLSAEERAKGFVRPVRLAYVHVGRPAPKYALRDLTPEEAAEHGEHGYIKYEKYPPSEEPIVGRYWTQKDLHAVEGGCGALTTMARALAETYARDPSFYGATYCVGCRMHRPVGPDGEFVWDGTEERVGT